MKLLFVISPGIIATCLVEKQKKEHLSSASFLKHTILFDFFTNIGVFLIYHYFYRGELSVVDMLNDSSFLLKYAGLSVVIALLLAFGYHFVAPYISVSVDSDEKEKESTNEKENT